MSGARPTNPRARMPVAAGSASALRSSHPTIATAAIEVVAGADWSAVRERWRDYATVGTATLFQQVGWLDAWYSRIIGQEPDTAPLLVEVLDAASGALVVALPLITVRRGRLRVLTFADLTLSDYNGPILGPAAPTTPQGAQSLWRALRRALPPHDLADLRKQPPVIAGRPNPFALLPGVTDCVLNGNMIALPQDWDDYHYGLVRHDRMEFERCWRVFQREPGARFVRIRDVAEAHAALDFLDMAQRERFDEVGETFVLDRPHVQAMYRHDLGARLANGTVVMTALKVDDAFVTAAFTIAAARTAVILRVANAGRRWKKIGPGVLSVHRTLHHLHAEGFERVDLSIGNYPYKTRLQPTPTPLRDLVQAWSWRGRPAAARHSAVAALRRHPQWDTRVRWVVGALSRRRRGG
jgi:CelD/BcsL family acetyltransferase involved in cellulose biosynthesis